MTEKEMISYFGKNIEVTCTDGEVLKGHVSSYTRAVDDDDTNEASIDLTIKDRPGITAIMQGEIQSIKILD